MRIAIRARKMRKRQQTTVIRKKTLELLPAVMQRKKIWMRRKLRKQKIQKTCRIAMMRRKLRKQKMCRIVMMRRKQINRKFRRKTSRVRFWSLPTAMPGIFLRIMSLKMRKSQKISRCWRISALLGSWMRTGKMKVVSIIIFRFFRESIFWQRAWSFRRSRSAWTAESLCWHQQILIILRMAVSASTATHWNSIRMRLSREAVRPMLFWLVVWRLQSRFRIWISGFRSIRTLRQQVTGYRRSDWQMVQTWIWFWREKTRSRAVICVRLLMCRKAVPWRSAEREA